MTNSDAKFPQVFRQCQALRQSLNQMEREAVRIQEIAINAAVAAGQTGTRSQIFGELAAQIANAGKRMNALAASARLEVNGMSSLTLQALVIERMVEKYQDAIPHLTHAGNKAHVEGVQGCMIDRNRWLMHRMFEHVAPIRTTLRNLEQVHYRLFAVLGVIRVESLELKGTHLTAVAALAGSLEERLGAAASETTKLGGIIRRIAFHAMRIAGSGTQEVGLEKVHAA